MKDWRGNVHFVLVEPSEPGNIGASARAIKSMGFGSIGLVRPAPLEGARRLAVHALDVLDKARVYESLKDALKDKALVVGTTRRKGRRRGVFVGFEEGIRRLREAARLSKTAVLFGRESRGLFNEELDECGFLITIPSISAIPGRAVSGQGPAGSGQPSLNLSHAVAIVAYELMKAGWGRTLKDRAPAAVKPSKPAGHAELEALYLRIERSLTLLEYLPKGDRRLEKKIMSNIKHLIGRAGLTGWELKMLHGLCTQVERLRRE